MNDANANNLHDILDLNPTKSSSSAWCLYEFSLLFSTVGTSQYFVQRFVTCKTLSDAKKALWIATVVSELLGAFLIPIIGMAAISYFAGCDPLQNGDITRNDALMPFMVSKVFEKVPGMTGLFISAAYRYSQVLNRIFRKK